MNKNALNGFLVLGRESLSITIICIFDPRPRARRIGAYEAPRNLALALK